MIKGIVKMWLFILLRVLGSWLVLPPTLATPCMEGTRNYEYLVKSMQEGDRLALVDENQYPNEINNV